MVIDNPCNVERILQIINLRFLQKSILAFGILDLLFGVIRDFMNYKIGVIIQREKLQKVLDRVFVQKS